jgi:hypothetical protein
MRVNTLRVIAVALIFVLFDVSAGGYRLLPDILGLAVLFFCAVLMTDGAKRFARTAVVAAVMIFLEVVRLFELAEAVPLAGFLGLLYVFLKVLLVITAADGAGQFGQLHGQEDIARLCDVTGHVYALTFVFSALSMWLTDLAAMFALINIIISVFVAVMFFYFFNIVIVPVQQPFDPAPEVIPESGEEGEGTEGAEEKETESVGAETP